MDFSAIQKAQTSFGAIAEELGINPTPEKIRGVVERKLAIELTKDKARMVDSDTIRKPGPQNCSYATLRSLAFVLRPYLRVEWASQAHTTSLLLAFGLGPGWEKLIGPRHNTESFHIMKSALEARQ